MLATMDDPVPIFGDYTSDDHPFLLLRHLDCSIFFSLHPFSPTLLSSTYFTLQLLLRPLSLGFSFLSHHLLLSSLRSHTPLFFSVFYFSFLFCGARLIALRTQALWIISFILCFFMQLVWSKKFEVKFFEWMKITTDSI